MDDKNTPSKQTEVAVYARVSTDSQELEHQLASCERWCAFKNFHIAAVHKEVGSGKSYSNRPEFVKMLADLRAMKYDGVVVFRLDRLFRNTVEAVNIIYELENKGIRVYSISENLDTSTPIGRAMRDIILSLASLERENISEATKARLQSLRDDGIKLGRPPASKYSIEKMMMLRGQGLSIREISEQMNSKKSTVAKYIKIMESDEPRERDVHKPGGLKNAVQ
jgi:site-specific DNA recombinase